MSDEGVSFPEACDYCGSPPEEEVRYPTATIDGENEDLHLFTFYSEECKGKFRNEHREELDRS